MAVTGRGALLQSAWLHRRRGRVKRSSTSYLYLTIQPADVDDTAAIIWADYLFQPVSAGGGDPAPLPIFSSLLAASGGTTYNLSGTAASTSSTSDTTALNVERNLSGTAASTSTTPDTLTLATGTVYNLSGTAASTSSTPDTVALNVARSLAGSAASTSTTPDTVTLTRIVALSGSAASTSVTTASNGAVVSTSDHVSVGVGYTDVSPKQVVRTSGNRVYTLLVNCDSYPGDGTSNQIMAYKGNQDGVPTSFTEQDSASRPSGGIAQWGIAIDSTGIIHVIYNTRATSGGNITDTLYVTFDTSTDTWGTSVSIDNTVNFSSGSTANQGVESVAIAVDGNDIPHVVYLATDGTRRRMKYRNRVGGSWSSATTVDDQTFASNEQIWHPNLVFDTTGRILTTFHIGTFDNTADGRVYIRTRETSGTWNTTVAVSGANAALTSIDNSGSLLVTSDNRYHLTFINASTTPANKYIRYYYSDDDGATWTANHPGSGTQATHNPALGMGANGNIRIMAHGAPDVSNVGVNLYYFEGAGGSSSWGSWTLWRTDTHVECSVNIRWAQYAYYNTQYLDVVYWDDRYPNDAYYGVDVLATGLELNVTRSLSGTAASTSSTPDTAALNVTRNLSGTAASTSSTPDTLTVSTGNVFNLSGTAASTSTTSDTVSLVVARDLSGSAASTSTTPDTAALNVERSLSGSAASTSTTPDTTALNVARSLSGTAASTSTTSDAVAFNVTRDLSGTAASTSSTPDTLTLNTGNVISLSGTAASTSSTSDTAALNVARSLSGSAASTSTTPDTVSLVIVRSFSGSAASTSTTPDTVALNVTRSLSGSAASLSSTPDTVILAVLRTLAGVAVSTSSTPDTLTLTTGDEVTIQGTIYIVISGNRPNVSASGAKPQVTASGAKPLITVETG